MSNIQAIIRRPSTVCATFTGKPSQEIRTRMKATGAQFQDGQWILTVTETNLGTEEDAVKAFEALVKGISI